MQRTKTRAPERHFVSRPPAYSRKSEQTPEEAIAEWYKNNPDRSEVMNMGGSYFNGKRMGGRSAANVRKKD